VKFSCARCGKKYATAETPAAGKVYKIKCKACGHLIVVKASSAEQQSATTELRAPTAADVPSHPAATPASELTSGGEAPGVALEIGAPEPHGEAASPASLDELPALTPSPNAGLPPVRLPHLDTTAEVALPLAAAPEPTPARVIPPPVVVAPPPPPPPAPVPAASGYVDLFADVKPEPEKPADDPFLAAARASLPDDYGKSAPAPDPFAPLGVPAERSAAPAPAAPKVPVLATPAQKKSSGPLYLIVAGAVVLVGILAFVLLGGGGPKPPAAPPAPPRVASAAPVPAPAAPVAAAPQAPAPAPAAPVAVAPPAHAAPAPAPAAHAAKPEKPKKESASERRAREREEKAAREREAREREKAAREARDREARDAREREREARDQRAREERDARERERIQQEQLRVAAASAGEPLPEALSQDQVQKVLSTNRKNFDACIGAAAKAGVELDGRRVMMRLNIQQAGTVAYPTLDDVTLNGTDLGSCLKSAARVMVFPKFKGDPMHVEVPLVLTPPK
jgi:DNA-directed RNA polymerase subunit RPC12/RpoP